jgi:C1A family cysteine protease
MTKTDYPYTSVKGGSCQFDETKSVFKNTGMVQERYMSNADLKRLVTKQPVTVGIVVTEAFRGYKGGILTEDTAKCSDEKKSINHAVTIVGFGKTESRTLENSWCKEFWIARNSWGSSWGENGNVKICMDKAGREKAPYGTCHINRYPSYPVAQ